MTGRLVDMAFTLGGKQRVTLEINGDFREIWDKLHQEPVLDVEIKKHREKRSLSANAYFHVLCNKISAETGESEDAVKRRLVVSYGALARDKDGKPVWAIGVSEDITPMSGSMKPGRKTEKTTPAILSTRKATRWIQRNLPVLWTAQSKKPRNWASRRIPRNSWLVTKKNGQNDRKGHFYGNDFDSL